MTAGDGSEPPIPVRRLVGVYHADGSIVGELRYWVGARLGRAHCALCDITHGLFRAKPGWSSCREQLAVPFETVHLDERDADLRTLTEGRTPCVVAETDHGGVVLLGPDDLEACDGSLDELMGRLESAATDRGLVVPRA